MIRQTTRPSVVITLLALSIVYSVGTTFFTIELEQLVERTITPHFAASSSVEAMNREICAGIDRFVASKRVRAVGYSCLVLGVLTWFYAQFQRGETEEAGDR